MAAESISNAARQSPTKLETPGRTQTPEPDANAGRNPRLLASAVLGPSAILLAVVAGFLRARDVTPLIIVLPISAGAFGAYLGMDCLRRAAKQDRRTAYAAIAANLLGMLLAIGLLAPLLLTE